MAGSLAAGFAAALILPFLPVGTVDVDFSTAMVLIGFALGSALLAVLSLRFTDQPQLWAVAPAIFMVLFALGGGYETISRSTGPAVAMCGQLVDVGPYRLHLECTGSGAPTVILEPGGGGSAASMGLIAAAVARDSRVYVCDRAGRGWSDPAATPPDGAQIAIDLHRLLGRAHVPGPYVLAGHFFGGLYVRTYAAKYPEEVAGLVLVDSTAAHRPPCPRGRRVRTAP